MNKYLLKIKLIRKIVNLILHFLRYIYLIKINKFEIEISALSKIINKDYVCLDIGCCHGSYARIMSKFGKFVYAVEPEKQNFIYLKDVLINENIDLSNIAISNKNITSNLYIPINKKKNLTALSSLSNNFTEFKFSNKFKVQKIKNITLDKFIKIKKIKKIDFIKIDVEGLEFAILQKSMFILKNLKPLLMIEIHKDKNNIYKKTFNLMTKMKYECFYLKRETNKLKKFKLKDIKVLQSEKFKIIKNKDFFDQSYIQNFFFIPNNKVKEILKLVSK